MNGQNVNKELDAYLKELHLPTVRNTYEELGRKAAGESLGYGEYLLELVRNECEARRQRRTERWLMESQLPLEKNLKSFEMSRLPKKVVQQVKVLLDGSFLDRKENLLAFGNPGSGKTHLLCALGQELIQQGRRVYCCTCSLLVQELLRGKRELRLEKLLNKLEKYEALILDDIGYVKQDRDEMEVFFTLLAQRYERGSLMITSNLPFSKWETIFKDPMTTAAAIDRLIHHSVILELNVPSYRIEEAKKRKQ